MSLALRMTFDPEFRRRFYLGVAQRRRFDQETERMSREIVVTDEMAEAAARALCQHNGVDPDADRPGTWDGGSYGVPPWKSWEEEARFALEAALA